MELEEKVLGLKEKMMLLEEWIGLACEGCDGFGSDGEVFEGGEVNEGVGGCSCGEGCCREKVSR